MNEFTIGQDERMDYLAATYRPPLCASSVASGAAPLAACFFAPSFTNFLDAIEGLRRERMASAYGAQREVAWQGSTCPMVSGER